MLSLFRTLPQYVQITIYASFILLLKQTRIKIHQHINHQHNQCKKIKSFEDFDKNKNSHKSKCKIMVKLRSSHFFAVFLQFCSKDLFLYRKFGIKKLKEAVHNHPLKWLQAQPVINLLIPDKIKS